MKHTGQYVLAYDLGTSGVKATLVSEAGVIVAGHTVGYPTRYDGPRAEQDPMAWWDAIQKATRALLEARQDAGRRIAAIGVSGHMTGLVAVDAEGVPLMPAMIHADARAADQLVAIKRRIGAEALYRMSGNVIDARSSLSKQLWVRDACPDLYGRTAKFLQSKDFVAARLTGNIDTTDYSDACHGVLMDIGRREYRGEVFAELGLDTGKLPTLHRSLEIIGVVSPESAGQLGITAGIPVIAGGGDGACGSAGALNVRVDDAYLSLGSTAWIAKVTQAPVIDPERRVFNIVNLDGNTSSVYGAMQSGGTALSWIKRLLDIPDYAALNAMAAAAEPGCGGLVFLPYLNGERSPVFDHDASGVFMGLSQGTGKGQLVRAVMEGVAFGLRQIREIIGGQTGAVNAVNAIGGGMSSPVWPGIIAEVTGLTLKRLSVDDADATSLGIAAAAGTAVGMFESIEAALSDIRAEQTFEGSVPGAAYARNYRRYLQIYPALKDAMHDM